jgi:hypothetical protein
MDKRFPQLSPKLLGLDPDSRYLVPGGGVVVDRSGFLGLQTLHGTEMMHARE